MRAEEGETQMAARKKAKKKASKKKAGRKKGEVLVVASKVKEAIKASGYRCSGDLIDALNAHIHGVLEGAVERCASNNRGTVRPYDL